MHNLFEVRNMITESKIILDKKIIQYLKCSQLNSYWY